MSRISCSTIDGNQSGREASTTGSKHDAKTPKLDENPNFAHQDGSGKIFGNDRGGKISRNDRNQTNGPRSSRCLVAWDQNVVSTVQKAECLQKLEVSPCMEAPDIWEECWRPACVLNMQSAMWITRCRRACVRSHAKRHTGCHQPEADWLLSSINRHDLPSVSTNPDLSKPS
ncbi:hypothetical protein DY000_02006656 [Brassica cretica]|uniref:ShKT domain-containing protein n=1 Tax=Brassica cretica TaxID=69181 RepID=A0ABQ7C6R2_BRACR|nr:hypothetical protein DY000_02006656 [Brassica cretica]